MRAGGGAAARGAAAFLALTLAGIAVAAAAVLAAGVWKAPDPAALAAALAWLAAMALAWRRGGGAGIGWPALAAIAVVSLTVRIWSVWLTQGVALGADPMNYTNLAHAMIEGRGMVVDDWRYGQGLRAYFPPLYPVLLAGFWSVLGDGAWSTLAMNTGTDLIAAWALRGAALRLGGGRAAADFAGLAYLAYPAFALSAGIPQKESLTVLLIVLLLRGVAGWLADDGAGARRWRHGLWLGLWWGALALAQPSLAIAPLAVALVLAGLRSWAATLRLGLTALPALVLVMLPWWIRNALLFGSFVPFTTASGFMANVALQDRGAPFPPGLFELSEPDRSALMAKLARQRIAEGPLDFLQGALRAQVLGFAYEEAPLARFRHTAPPISAADHARLAPLLQFGWLALTASAAAGAWRQFRTASAGPLVCFAAALFLAIGATNIWFEFGERHRYVLTPFLMLIAAGFWLRSLPTSEPPRPRG